MVRLVFRPYTQVRRSICTLEPLRTSTRVSPGFVLLRHSSPSFGSQHLCSNSNLFPEGAWSVDSAVKNFLPQYRVSLLSFRARDYTPNTRTHVRLLGPCFKTGWCKAFWKGPSIARLRTQFNEQHSFPHNQRSLPTRVYKVHQQYTALHLFLFSNFRYCFTLFSKFFSSFPHGTCLLSVSLPYLALDGIYHLLELHSQTTRLLENTEQSISLVQTGLSPSTADLSRSLYQRYLPPVILSRPQLRRLSVWALPASLAVTEGIFVNFFSSA